MARTGMTTVQHRPSTGDAIMVSQDKNIGVEDENGISYRENSKNMKITDPEQIVRQDTWPSQTGPQDYNDSQTPGVNTSLAI